MKLFGETIVWIILNDNVWFIRRFDNEFIQMGMKLFDEFIVWNIL